MIKRLRRKFILTAMSAVIIVLLIIMGTVNITNFIKINQRADEVLEFLAENHGIFPKPNKPRQEPREPREIRGRSQEAPYETRYFTVILNSDKEAEVNTGFIAAVNPEEAEQYGKKAIESGKSEGFVGDYKYLTVNSESGVMVIFLDCGRDLSMLRSFFATSVMVSVVGILSVLVLIVIFSKIVLRPVAESYEKQKRFITDAGHEIKTPLTIIGANTEVIEMENGESQWTRSIKNQITGLSCLTENLITLSRMDEESYMLEITEFSLSEAVLEMMEPVSALVKIKDKSLTLDVEKNVSSKGNEEAIRRLVSIIMDNAVKYSNEKGEIKVTLKRQGKYKELSVYNTVDTIERGNLEEIFERFYRGDTSRNSQNTGYGIGLSIAKVIAENHGGKVLAKSSDGKSILVTILLRA